MVDKLRKDAKRSGSHDFPAPLNIEGSDSGEDLINSSRDREDGVLLRSEIRKQHSFIDDRFVGEKVTVEEAFERCGGFGRF